MRVILSFLKHLVVPYPENDYQAKLIQPDFLSLLSLVVLFLPFSLRLLALVQPGVLGYTSEITPERIVELTNKEREKHNLPPLRVSPLLNEAALRKAADMFAFDYWAHTSPSGRDPWSFFKEVGYEFRFAGENLARDFVDPESVVRAWMRSPSHRENILNPRYQEIGVAVVEGTLQGVETTLVVQFFGTPTHPYQKLLTTIRPTQRFILPTAVAAATTAVKAAPKINPLVLSKGIAAVLLVVIGGVVVFDTWLARKQRVTRIKGRAVAHLLVVLTLLAFTWWSKPGMIK